MRAHLAPLAAALAITAGCGGGDGSTPDATVDPEPDAYPPAPVFRNPVALPDDELALAALQLLGADVEGAVERCDGCHGLTRQKLRQWRALSDASIADCFTDFSLASQATARATIDCFRTMPAVPTSAFQTRKLGIWSTAAELPWFEYLFERAYGDQGAAELAGFREFTAMPPAPVATFTQAEFDIVAEWFARGLPELDDTLVEDPPPDDCEPGISADVAAHVTAMTTTGWRQRNADASMAMFGCAGAATTLDCLADEPRATTLPYATSWEVGNGTLRVLKENAFHTSYWTRSSVDGRFVAAGVADFPGSKVVDLIDEREITVEDAAYDPAFFSDGRGFVFQPQGDRENVCSMGILLDPTKTSFSMRDENSYCTKLETVDLYESVGQVPDGDYFAIDSQFVSDDGGHEPTLRDPDASFDGNAYAWFTPMQESSNLFQALEGTEVDKPNEGDFVMSPSSKLLMSRVSGPNDRQLGYVLYRVDATRNVPGSDEAYDIEMPEIGRFCFSGGKPAFSFDERWVVYHHYVVADDAVALGFTGASDPAFAPYLTEGAANVYLLDILTGERTRLTHMEPGQYALFPHFRSDGWIYFNVRDFVGADATDREYVVASDAALLAEQP